MTIDDIIRFFSGAADGQRMGEGPAAPVVTPMAQAMGSGRATVTPAAGSSMPQGAPRINNPEDPMASAVAASPAYQPMPQAQPAAPIAAAMSQGPSAASMAPDNRDVGGGQNIAMSQPPMAAAMAPQRGFLDKALDNSKTGVSPLEYVLRGLGAAGSADPMKVMMQYAAQDSENEKIRQARIKANQPKIDQINGTPFFQITYPDGRTEVSSNPALANYFKSQSESKQNAAIEKAVLDDRLARGRDQSKADIKASEEARPLLNDIQGLKGRWAQAKEIVGTQGTMAQVQGIPVISGIAGFFGGDEVAKNKFLEGLTVDETLLNTARTKGAISNQEMNLFKSPLPSVTDDREKVWKPWIERRLEVLDKLEKFYTNETGRTSAGASATGQSAPPPSEQLQAAVTAAGIPYEPDKYQYRIGPNGQVQRKAK